MGSSCVAPDIMLFVRVLLFSLYFRRSPQEAGPKREDRRLLAAEAPAQAQEGRPATTPIRNINQVKQ